MQLKRLITTVVIEVRTGQIQQRTPTASNHEPLEVRPAYPQGIPTNLGQRLELEPLNTPHLMGDHQPRRSQPPRTNLTK
ncbi:MAG: hypothetical protein OXE59_02430 [Bacteroidetes bacterium]|nr:hypothetical protein [Bacteroidota bacterium]